VLIYIDHLVSKDSRILSVASLLSTLTPIMNQGRLGLLEKQPIISRGVQEQPAPLTFRYGIHEVRLTTNCTTLYDLKASSLRSSQLLLRNRL
jgi:hypothetical protein